MTEFEGKAHYPLNLDDLPSGWGSALVGDLCSDIQSGFASGEHNAQGNGIPHIRPMNIERDGRFVLETIKYVSADVDERRLLRGDVLFNNTNSPVLVGKTTAISTDLDLGFSNHMTRLRPLPGVDYRFLAHELHFLWMCGFFAKRCNNHVNQASVSAETLSATVPVSLAPPDEQVRIVDAIESYLSRLDTAVATLEAAQAKLKAYRASVLKAAVEGRLVPTEAALARAETRHFEPADLLLKRVLSERRRRWEEAELARRKTADKSPKDDKWKTKYEEPESPDTKALPALPEGWCWASVDQVGDVLLGRQRAPQYLTGRWSRPYLRVANIKDDRVDLGDVEEMDFNDAHFAKYQLRTGDILVSEGQSPHLVGQSAIYVGGIAGLCFQKTLHRFRAVEGVPTSGFAQLVFRAHVRLRVFQKVASITTNIAHLTLEKFKESRFPLPPTAEQERILLEAERLLSVADAVEGQVTTERARIGRLRQAVLKWAFSGKLVDQDATEEPAENLLERLRAKRANAATPKRIRQTPKAQ